MWGLRFRVRVSMPFCYKCEIPARVQTRKFPKTVGAFDFAGTCVRDSRGQDHTSARNVLFLRLLLGRGTKVCGNCSITRMGHITCTISGRVE